MPQKFKQKSATIIAARERSMMNANGDYVTKVIISLDKGKDVFAPLSVVQNAVNRMIGRNDLDELEDSVLHYIASNVKQGDEFAFVEGGDIQDEPAHADMQVTTIKGVRKTKDLKKFLKSCPIYVQATERKIEDDAEKGDGTGAPTIEELTAELAEITNVIGMRAFVQDNAIFDDHSDAFADFTTAAQYREALADILTSTPF